MICRKLIKKKPSDNNQNFPPQNESIHKESIFLKPLRVPFFGAAKVGKTSIIKAFVSQKFSEDYTPTIEDYYKKYFKCNGKLFQLDITDTGGLESFTAMRRLAIKNADIMVLVYSLRSPETFETLIPIKDEIVKIHGNSKPVIVIAGKSDLDVQGKNIEYVTSRGKKIETKKVVEKEWKYLWIIASARMNWGIEMIFYNVLDEFLRRRAIFELEAMTELKSVAEYLPNFPI